MSTLGWVGLFVTLLVWGGVWFGFGLGKGRTYGNKLAAHLGWRKNFFHTVLDMGTGDQSLMLLNGFSRSGQDLRAVAVVLAPTLAAGLNALESRFGTQPEIESAKQTVVKLLEEHRSTLASAS